MAQSVEQRFRKPQVEGSSPSVGSLFRGVAQFGSAFGSGPKGRGFESRHFDTKNEATCNKASRFFLCAFRKYAQVWDRLWIAWVEENWVEMG